jgi:hypothetical protein
MAGPLDGIVRVLDLSERSPAAAIAGMVLADLGAEVIRVEPEGGDPLRALSGSRVWLRGQKSAIVGASQMANGEWAGCVILPTLSSTPHNRGRKSPPAYLTDLAATAVKYSRDADGVSAHSGGTRVI